MSKTDHFKSCTWFLSYSFVNSQLTPVFSFQFACVAIGKIQLSNDIELQVKFKMIRLEKKNWKEIHIEIVIEERPGNCNFFIGFHFQLIFHYTKDWLKRRHFSKENMMYCPWCMPNWSLPRWDRFQSRYKQIRNTYCK